MNAKRPSKPPFSVLLIEDEPRAIARCQRDLRDDPSFSLLAAVPRLTEAIRILQASSPDLILFDLVLQRVDRGSEIAALKDRAPQARVLVLTAYEEPRRIFRALCAGADGYLVKTDEPRVLGRALREIMEYGSTFSPSVARVMAQHFHAVGKENRQAGFEKLTAQQEHILQHLCQGFTNKEIARKLNLSCATVKNHVDAIFAALRVTNRTQAAVLSRLRPTWLRKK